MSVPEFAGGSCAVAPYGIVCGTASPTGTARCPRNINRVEQSAVETRIANRAALSSMGGSPLPPPPKSGPYDKRPPSLPASSYDVIWSQAKSLIDASTRDLSRVDYLNRQPQTFT